jgi:beta-galactosidase
MKNKISVLIICGVLLLLISCSEKNQTLDFERESFFNSGWKFIRTDVANAQSPDFDDTSWRDIILPHDWSIEDLPEKEGVKQIGPFSEESLGGDATGHVIGGTAWYRKHFTFNKSDEGKIIKILFDGVYMDADVWINGQYLGNHPYGYTAFSYDLTPYLKPAGEENILAVQVKNEGKNSRWYSGSGIYRNVSLIKTNPVYIELWGNYITTPEATSEKARINCETKLVNKQGKKVEAEIAVSILNNEGELVGETEQKTVLEAGKEGIVNQQIEVILPKLWSPDSPVLYTAIIEIGNGKKIIDQVKTNFGIRRIDFSPEKGLLLNGKSILLKGACMHHDNGPLGSVAFYRAEYRRVQIMKENGFNAIRTAHNPPSRAFLDACDELGILVLDEAFDQWQRPKNPRDYNLFFKEWWQRDLESMVLRDRNHPSVIIWSIGNEINERADSSGLIIAKMLKNKIKEIDKTHPVTQAICEFWDHPGRGWDSTALAFKLMDVDGYNYQWARYESDHEKYPERIMMGTESVPKEAFENWQMVEKHPYVVGDFVWTGMDYLGESGIGNVRSDDVKWGFLPPWPWYDSNCGDISILGYKKPQMFFRDVVWRNSNLEMLVHAPMPDGLKEIVSFWGWSDEIKSWNWSGNEGKPLRVSVYTRADKVRLELNGKVIGEKEVSEETKLTAKFEAPYQPGELVAVALKNGEEVARQTLQTTGNPAALKMTAERNQIDADPSDLAYFNVEVIDENGLLVPDANVNVQFDIKGGYNLQAVANGKPDEMQSFQKPKINTFRGRCQLIIRSSEKEGTISIEAKSVGLKASTAVVKVVKK